MKILLEQIYSGDSKMLGEGREDRVEKSRKIPYNQKTMLQSKLFTKTLKTFPKDEEAINAKLLLRGGFIRKSSSGVYVYLPLALRVLDKINKIIREEMNAIGAQELLMPTLVAKEYWDKSRRWHTDIAYEFKSPFGEEFALGSARNLV